MPADEWLAARPIAHRGLHDGKTVIENTPSAFSAAISAGYAIELDIQISRDGEAMVHHDHALGRLTDANGELADLNAAELKGVAFKATSDRMMTLGELADLVAGRVGLFVEVKSRFDGDSRAVKRAVEILKDYRGPVALMSFDPDVVADVRAAAPGIPRGIIAERHYTHTEWSRLGAGQKLAMAHLLHIWRTRPHFVAYHVKDLPTAATLLTRRVFGLPLLTWTVRSEEDRKRAASWADQMIFEGFRP